MESKVIIGLDLGPTSIGISAIDESGKILTKTSVLRVLDNYDKTGSKTSAADRREHRCTRRRYSRKKTLKKDFKKLVSQYFKEVDFDNLFKFSKNNANIYEIKRSLILEGKSISLDDFIKCLYHYLDKRGCIYGGTDLKGKLPIEHLFDIYKKKGTFKFNKLENFNKSSQDENNVDNRINRKDYKKEIEDYFFPLWFKFNNSIDKDKFNKFKDEFLRLFERQRSYEFGPGNEKTFTKYGLCYQNFVREQNGKPKEKLFDHLIGKCSIYPNQSRSIKNVSFEIFKFLEYINNHRYVNTQTGEANSFEDKKNIFKYLVDQCCNLSSKVFKKFNVEIDRFNNENKVEYKKQNFNHLFFYKEHWKSSNFNLFVNDGNELNVDFINELNDIDEQIKNTINLSGYEDSDNKKYDKVAFDQDIEKWNKICKKIGCTTDEIYEKLLCVFGKQFFSTCKLSRKALNNAISILYRAREKGANLQKIISQYSQIFDNNQKISTNKLVSQINTPNVKRIIQLTILALNKFIELNNFNRENITICVETTHDHNNYKEKKRIEEVNKNNRQLNQSIYDENPNISKKDLLKRRLYDECGGKSVYTNKPIDLNKLDNYEIDHIYNFEWSGDNSFNNKVLVEKEQNFKKGTKTIASFLGLQKQKEYITENDAWIKIKENNPRKYEKLINNELDFHKICEGFNGRNLSDTSYISSLIEKILKKEFGAKEIVRTNGKITNYVRNIINYDKKKSTDQVDLDFIKNNYEKNRLDYKHHGIDAIAIAYSYFFNDHIRSNVEKWEIRKNEITLFDEIKTKSNSNQVQQYISKKENFLFWTPVSRKIKKNFFNETLYSYKKIDNKFFQIKKINIADESNQDIQKILQDKESFFMYHSKQKDLFETIFNIFQKYKDISDLKKINAFQYYMNENNDTFSTDKNGKLNWKKYSVIEIKNYKNKELQHSLKIRSLKYLSKQPSLDKSFYSPLHQRGNKNLGGYTSFPFQRLLIYKNKFNDEWELLNLTITLVDQNNKKNNYLKEFSRKRKSIIANCSSYIDIFKGQKIILKESEPEFEISGIKIKHNVIYEIIGFKNSSKNIEIKSISGKKNEKERLVLSFKKIPIKFDFLKLDLLGNIIKRKSLLN